MWDAIRDFRYMVVVWLRSVDNLLPLRCWAGSGLCNQTSGGGGGGGGVMEEKKKNKGRGGKGEFM